MYMHLHTHIIHPYPQIPPLRRLRPLHGPELDFRGGTGHQDLLRRVGGYALWLLMLLMLESDGFLVDYYANMPGYDGFLCECAGL